MEAPRRYPFNEGVVIVGKTLTGFVAVREDFELPRGHGYSILSAIANLNEKIEREGSIYEREEDYTPIQIAAE